jgi:hypothetical protein
VPDHRSHRGPDPHDVLAFAPSARPALRDATADLAWLLGKGYAPVSALKLVGDRRSLTARQRLAVMRSACPDDALAHRACRRIEPEEAAGGWVVIDGFNVLTTVEAALGGAAVFLGRDGCLRDIAGVHGTYRAVEETVPAVRLTGEVLAALRVAGATWLLDRPVSNSGRLRALILDTADGLGWGWRVELVVDPDPVLAASAEVVATADSAVLDRCGRWLNLAWLVVESSVPGANVVDLSGEGA